MPSLLSDPCDDRPVKELPPPPAQLMTRGNLFDADGQPNLKVLSDHLAGEGLLTQEALLDLIAKAADIFRDEPNILKLNDPITIVGDLHGQYYDFLKLLEVGGAPGETQYLFLGDYVDRGSFSIEVVALLFATKIRHPKRIRMLRGNHECRQMTSFFNFREECEYKYDIGIYDAIMDAFDNLPLAATVNGKFLAVHGGLSPELLYLKTINTLDRFKEPPREGLMCDLLWADPLEPKEGEEDSAVRKKGGPAFTHNEVRGCSYFYSLDGAARFLRKNNLLSVIRAHEAQLEGYKMHKGSSSSGFPSVITIFSAPNYCDVFANKGAILKFNNSTLNILQFNCVPHPYHLPNFMDIFAWSMPFVIEKVSEILFDIMNSDKSSGPLVDGSELDDTPELPNLPDTISQNFRSSLTREQNDVVELASKLAAHIENMKGGETGSDPVSGPVTDEETRNRLRKKVRTVGRIARMWKTLREENETVIKLKGVCPGHRLKPGLLLAGKDAMESKLDEFTRIRDMDVVNELRPGSPTGSLAVGAGTLPRDFDAFDADDDDGHTESEPCPEPVLAQR